MAFPLTYSGHVVFERLPVEGLSREGALARIAKAVKAERPSVLEADDHEVRFRTKAFSTWNWKVLSMVDGGSFTVSETPDRLTVSFELSYRHTFVIATAMVVFVLGPLVIRDVTMPLGMRLGILAFAWTWTFVLNYRISVGRFPDFIRRALVSNP